ncbi:mannosyl-oligosaccharide glucosidase GCS1 [Venturia canescens]|uniref:mannosyl-oligosaccharide glucosidase GCS1 n=1 Tax=Venturia canescens TaxID=32260 RepID=UPI001C9CFB04|nr:mannosyl-oligosaccharide glucosidase GCS1 [Venturia canescens]
MAKPKGNERSTRSRVKIVAPDDPLEETTVKIPVLKTILTAACIAVAAWFSYKGYLETRVNTPYSTEKLVTVANLNSLDRYWGSYRPGTYFGLKTRDPHSLVTGLMWYFPHYLRQGGEGFRHWCEQGDRLDRYAWLEHDGRNFGTQEIVDGGVVIRTSFVKKVGGSNGGDWTARISVNSENPNRNGEELSMLFYGAMEGKARGRMNASLSDESKLLGIEGYTQALGTFKITLNARKGFIEENSYLTTVAPGLHLLKETVLHNLRIASHKGSTKKHIILAGEQLPLSPENKKLEPNFVVSQVTSKIPFEFEVNFESGSFVDRNEKLMGQIYDDALAEHKRRFDDKFERVFKLRSKGFDEEAVDFGKMAFSNMIGSIGYFYGNSQVQSVFTKTPVPYWKAPLYTAVPSRSFFPRGFLWDEGFHGLLLAAWDVDIEMDIMSHWFDLMNVEGWIPREMILGQEAMAKVPEEFVTQVNTNANPPTFFLTLNFILEHREDELLLRHYKLLDKLYPRLQAWFEWFNTTQAGDSPGTYRWRGRDGTTLRELNPKTLTSGLDDYPRASHPNIDERHVDLRCWIGFAAGVMTRLAEILHEPAEKYKNTHDYLNDNALLNKLHWSPNTQSYADFGLHTDRVELRRPMTPPRSHAPSSEMIRFVLEDPTLRYIDTSFGYVSLFPFILQIVRPDSPQLGKILDDLTNPDLLWTKYGLRSLAKTSPIYMKYNTEHDAPYWRGPIWINLNYLTLRALNHYSAIEGPHQSKATKIYTQLRDNLIKNMIGQYRKTGYVWENYGDKHGEGKGSHPFSGWSSLIVLIMAEIY